MSDPRRSAPALRRWWPLALAVPLGAAAGAGYAAVAPVVYTANSYVVVVAQSPGEGGAAVNFAQAYGRLAGQPQVLAAAAAKTGRTVSALESAVRGTTSPDAPVIEITGTGPAAADAVKAADAVAASLIAFAGTSASDTGVKLVPLARAASPDAPSSPSAALDTAVGAAAGVLVGALAVMARRRPGAEPEADAGAPPVPAQPRVQQPAGAVR
ncbi:hypothetical protein KNE206_35660 [Kitasatospora sp. NE20-6]|uniref:lipopolysaccharide biosynthesis protein n=1 Tax=Kitasatospora sp. NE20-6 TaxID=2859066 RepID=UPI0034DBC83C